MPFLKCTGNDNFKQKSGRKKSKKTRERRRHGRDVPSSFIRKEKLLGAEARAKTVDKRSVKEQRVQERRPKGAGQKRVRGVGGKRYKKKDTRREKRDMLCHGRYSRNVG